MGGGSGGVEAVLIQDRDSTSPAAGLGPRMTTHRGLRSRKVGAIPAGLRRLIALRDRTANGSTLLSWPSRGVIVSS